MQRDWGWIYTYIYIYICAWMNEPFLNFILGILGVGSFWLIRVGFASFASCGFLV